MSKKTKNVLEMACPVPPWTPKNIVKLAKYLGLSQAKLTEMIGISYSALRAWIDGRSQSISAKILARLETFEEEIPALRGEAEERLKDVVERESRRKSRMNKPWPVSRIRSFMHTWGMTQVEFAIFAGVSYDTITSWSRGRRRLVRKETADHIAEAEKTGLERGFKKGTPSKKDNPWALIRAFGALHGSVRPAVPLNRTLLDTYACQVVEKSPRKMSMGKSSEKVVISAGGKKDRVHVEMKLAGETLKLNGIWRRLGGSKVIELLADDDDDRFFMGHAGCITPGKTTLKISLWAKTDLPVRFTAVKK